MLQPHIRLNAELINTRYALLAGDPARVLRIAEKLVNVTHLAKNREYLSLTGQYKGINILVMSTGIGAPSMAIAVHELQQIGVSTLIRVGSCGAFQAKLKIGELVLPNGSVRDEGTSKMYIDQSYPAIPNSELFFTLQKTAKQLQLPIHIGINRSHDSFYTQKEPQILEYWNQANVLSADMETSILFVLGSLYNLATASILNVVVEMEDDNADSINNYVEDEQGATQGEHREIELALETLYRFSTSDN